MVGCPANSPEVVTLSGPGDLAAALPHLFGFVPSESVVLLGLHGPRKRINLSLRLDLYAPEHDHVIAEDLGQARPADRAGRRPDHRADREPRTRTVTCLDGTWWTSFCWRCDRRWWTRCWSVTAAGGPTSATRDVIAQGRDGREPRIGRSGRGGGRPRRAGPVGVARPRGGGPFRSPRRAGSRRSVPGRPWTGSATSGAGVHARTWRPGRSPGSATWWRLRRPSDHDPLPTTPPSSSCCATMCRAATRFSVSTSTMTLRQLLG